MRKALAVLGGVGVLIVGLWGNSRADDGWRPGSVLEPAPSWPERRGFDVEVLVGGRPLVADRVGGRHRVWAVPGADYELRITNPLPVRVAVALSVDGLNTIDARRTDSWDASKWLIRPYQTLTVSGWQVGTDRARRFTFTTERDSYAAKLGTPGDPGVITAVFYRERRPVEITPPRREAVPVPYGFKDAAGAPSASARAESLGGRLGRGDRSGYDRGRAATGIGRSERHEVSVVDMALERAPVATVEVRYAYRPHRPYFAPDPDRPSRDGSGTDTGNLHFCPEP